MTGTITIVDPVLPERGRSSNILALVLIVIIVAVSIVIAIVVHMMIEFCGGCWLRPFSEDLFQPRAPVAGNRIFCTWLEAPLHARKPHRQSKSAETTASTESNVYLYTSSPRINNSTILLFGVAGACLHRACASARQLSSQDTPVTEFALSSEQYLNHMLANRKSNGSPHQYCNEGEIGSKMIEGLETRFFEPGGYKIELLLA